jgi:hypothetical protein
MLGIYIKILLAVPVLIGLKVSLRESLGPQAFHFFCRIHCRPSGSDSGSDPRRNVLAPGSTKFLQYFIGVESASWDLRSNRILGVHHSIRCWFVQYWTPQNIFDRIGLFSVRSTVHRRTWTAGHLM